MSNAHLPSPLKLRNYGSCAPAYLEKCFDFSPAGWDFKCWQSSDSLPQQNREIVAALLAELAFWQATIVTKTAADFPAWLLTVAPFCDLEMPLAELLPLAEKSGMAMFPLAGRGEHPPQMMRIYVLDTTLPQDAKKRLSFAQSIGKKHSILLGGAHEVKNGKIDGDSWQLAAELAKAAITGRDWREKLGTGWVCTGAVNARREIKPVELGNKAELTANYERRWLLPDGENFQHWCEQTGKPGDGFGVLNLNEALTYVRESGVVEHTFSFPQDIEELHLLLGKSLLPAVTVSMLIYPRRLCLWYTDETEKHANALRAELKAAADVTFTIALHKMPSDNMGMAEVRLREQLQITDCQKSLVNFTGGNRLMGVAAMLAARHCQVSMVYRDINAPPDQLEMIDFSRDPNLLPRNGKIKGNNCPEPLRTKLNWEALYKTKSTQKPADEESELKKELHATIWRKENSSGI